MLECSPSSRRSSILPRRWGYLGLGLVMGYLVALDFSRSALKLDPLQYEWLRICGPASTPDRCSSSSDGPWRVAASTTGGLLILGFATYHGVNKALATSAMFPCSFGVMIRVRAHRAWDAARLRLQPLAAFSRPRPPCASLLLFRAQHPEARGHHPGLRPLRRDSIIAVLMAGSSSPRSSGAGPGQDFAASPPRCSPPSSGPTPHPGRRLHGPRREQTSVPSCSASSTRIGLALGVFLHHRHQLVIHTDNVGQLLEERTAALLDAKKELARAERDPRGGAGRAGPHLDRKSKDLQLQNDGSSTRQRRPRAGGPGPWLGAGRPRHPEPPLRPSSTEAHREAWRRSAR